MKRKEKGEKEEKKNIQREDGEVYKNIAQKSSKLLEKLPYCINVEPLRRPSSLVLQPFDCRVNCAIVAGHGIVATYSCILLATSSPERVQAVHLPPH